MKHIVRKVYIDYEKEENWLNDMSAKGLALADGGIIGYHVIRHIKKALKLKKEQIVYGS